MVKWRCSCRESFCDCWDAEAMIDGDWVEIVGISDSGTYDLTRHQESSGENMNVNIDGQRYLPRVVEPAHGIDRIFMAVLKHSCYRRDSGYKILKLNLEIAQYHAAILPLMKKEGLKDFASELYGKINEFDPPLVYDETGIIGKRYAGQDEIGTRFCIAADYQTLEDRTVTVRFRDPTEQIRISADLLLKERRIVGNGALAELTQSYLSLLFRWGMRVRLPCCTQDPPHQLSHF